MLWRSATPLRVRRGEHEETLEMLARGFTDARIALALNVSARTVSRRVSEIMTEYGAGSRFELGMMYGRDR
jgi:DNA-binding NarL/FixJ family response regulator